MADKCEDCKYWEEDNDAPRPGEGFCRRYPPVNHGYQTFEHDGNVAVAFRWPVTKSANWCGELVAE